LREGKKKMSDGKNAGGSEKKELNRTEAKTVKDIAVDQILVERDALKEQVANLEKRLKDIEKERDELKTLRHDELKTSMGSQLVKLTNYDAEDINAMTLQEIAEKLETAKHVKGPSYKSIRFGAAAIDEGDQGYTVGDLSIVTEERRERARKMRGG